MVVRSKSLLYALDALQHIAGQWQQQTALRVELQAVAYTLKQTGIELLFKLRQCHGGGRRGEVNPLGGLGHLACAGHGFKNH